MLNFIIWLLVGALIGWIATSVMRDPSNLLINIVVGILGAFVAGWLLTPLFGVSTINQGNFSLPAMFVSFLGAVLLLAVINLFRRGMVR